MAPKRKEASLQFDNYYVNDKGVMVIFARNGNVRQETSHRPPETHRATVEEMKKLMLDAANIEEIMKISDKLLSSALHS